MSRKWQPTPGPVDLSGALRIDLTEGQSFNFETGAFTPRAIMDVYEILDWNDRGTARTSPLIRNLAGESFAANLRMLADAIEGKVEIGYPVADLEAKP